MANRVCPICFAKLPVPRAAAQSYGTTCPSCGRALELSRPSRLLASYLGLAGGWLAYSWVSRAVAGRDDLAGWFLPVVVAIVAYGVVSALFLLFNSDVVVRAEAPAEAVVAGGGGHGAAAYH